MANADPEELVPILMQAQPNKVRLGGADEEKYTQKLLAKAKVIADSANRIWRKLQRNTGSFPKNPALTSKLRDRNATGPRRRGVEHIPLTSALVLLVYILAEKSCRHHSRRVSLCRSR